MKSFGFAVRKDGDGKKTLDSRGENSQARVRYSVICASRVPRTCMSCVLTKHPLYGLLFFFK
jgi:hypothetical protein